MTRAEARGIIEDYEMGLEAWHECRAEAGMGAVSMGFSGYDGMSEYATAHPMPVEDERVREARVVLSA